MPAEATFGGYDITVCESARPRSAPFLRGRRVHLPRRSLRQFADADITNQQLIDESIVLRERRPHRAQPANRRIIGESGNPSKALQIARRNWTEPLYHFPHATESLPANPLTKVSVLGCPKNLPQPALQMLDLACPSVSDSGCPQTHVFERPHFYKRGVSIGRRNTSSKSTCRSLEG